MNSSYVQLVGFDKSTMEDVETPCEILRWKACSKSYIIYGGVNFQRMNTS